MSGLDRIRLGWAALRTAKKGAAQMLSVHGLAVHCTHGELLLGLDESDAQHLLVPIAVEGPEDRESEAVQIVNRSFEAAGTERLFADVACSATGMGDVYDHLLADMVEQVSRTPDRCAEACVAVLDRWRDLLRPAGTVGLSVHRLAGLFAELLVLLDLVREDPQRRSDAWVGPDGARHDFRRGRNALEVKASLATTRREVEVHGLDQLLPPEGGRLHLVWTRLERVPGAGRSVIDLVEELLELGVGSHDLLARLARAGSPPGLAEQHGMTTFEVRERRIHPVDDRFPKLTQRELIGGAAPAGVEDVRYRVDLSREELRPLDDDEVHALIHEIATEGAPSLA